ncbi:MAG: alpha/beta fold hydrolase [Chloroflexota bacterium]
MIQKRGIVTALGQKRPPDLAPKGLLTGLAMGTLFICALTLVSSIVSTFTFKTFLENGAANWLLTKQEQFQFHVRSPLPVTILTATPAPTPHPSTGHQQAIIHSPQASQTPTPFIQPDTASTTVSGLINIPTPHPMDDFTITSLRNRPYLGGQIEIQSILDTNKHFTRYYISYPSDGLTITGIMQVPTIGRQPFPVIILNHGYIPQEKYWSGSDTWNAASYLNRQGYLTISPDFRSWGESDTDNSFFSTGQLIDVLNLVSSLSSLPYIDNERIGMWGHSMGGGITLKAITIDPRIKAAILYAPVSGYDSEWLARWGPGCSSNQPYALSSKCGGAEILVDDIDEDLFSAYADALNDPVLLSQTSAMNYLHHVIVPVQIHIGLADTRTPPKWAEAIHQGLVKAGKETELFTYPNQGHAFRNQGWRSFMESATDFFDHHLANAYGLG